jgi:hypothetical protein
MDQEQAAFRNMGDDLVDHLFSSEKDRPLVGLERAKTRVGTDREPKRRSFM